MAGKSVAVIIVAVLELPCFMASASAQEYHCDVNDDGTVTVLDATIIINHVLGKHHHAEAIDLGLPSGIKWANCNVGATRPEQMGEYFAWGETNAKSEYTLATYVLCNGSFDSCFDFGSRTISGTQFDVAHTRWGGTWRIPTNEEVKELRENCTFRWITYRGVTGAKFIGPNGKSIFLPAAGYSYGSNVGVKGENGFYWTATQYGAYPYMGYSFDFASDYVTWGDYYRSLGFTIRPVCE